MKKLLAVGMMALFALGAAGFEAGAASKKKKTTKPKYSEAQLKEIRKNAMDICRKRYGAGLIIRASFDYRTNRVICYTH